MKTYEEGEGLLLLDGEAVDLLSVVHDEVVLPVGVHDEDDVVHAGAVGQEPQHGHAAVARKGLVVENAA